MYPSVLAGQIEQGIKDFLQATFPSSTPFFHGMLERLLNEDRKQLFRGPYLSIQLPFRQGRGVSIFPDLPMRFVPHLHQEQAFERLQSDVRRSTLVATGTGSGKSECFLYPILDHCLRQKGSKGIKAILIYPMNALAQDQSKRIARLIMQTPALKAAGIRAGLYIGEQDNGGSSHHGMGDDHVLTNHDTMKDSPPDILMTNYKMLDYLLLRPKDQKLWQHNTPETLRYVVVDELHTFDGAQGTDLACLLRRLKDRLRVPRGTLCCVGTSATVGGRSSEDELRRYAEAIFGEPFVGDCILRESRLSFGAYLSDSLITDLQVHLSDASALSPQNYTSEEAYLRAQYKIWFGETYDGPLDESWRVALGQRLKQHLFFQNLLRSLRGEVRLVEEIAQEMARFSPLPKGVDVEMARLLDSLCALISAAKVRPMREGVPMETGVLPFLHVRIQLWLHELRRVVAEVHHTPRLRFADERQEEDPIRTLPLVQCRECGATGWGGLFRQGEEKIRDNPRDFYLQFFKRMKDLVFLFPTEEEDPMSKRLGHAYRVCSGCLHLNDAQASACTNCGEEDLVMIRRVREIKTDRNGHHFASRDCPYCEGEESLTIFGSRIASLTSVMLSQLYGSFYNDDKKAITFSDSVQDAAHRAGFFGARTYRFTFRTALQQCVQAQNKPISLAALPSVMTQYWQETQKLSPETYAAIFIAPNMEWLSGYTGLQEHGKISTNDELFWLIAQRLTWEIYAEYGYRAWIGRTLERSGNSVASPDKERLERAITEALLSLQNEVEAARTLTEAALWSFVLGIVTHLRLQGAIFVPLLDEYVSSLGDTFTLGRHRWSPSISPQQRVPSFVLERWTKRSDFESLHGNRYNQSSWYQRWCYKFFEEGDGKLLDESQVQAILECVWKALCKAGILEERTEQGFRLWGLRGQSLWVTTDTVSMRCDRCSHDVTTASDYRERWEGMPCLQRGCQGHYRRFEREADYYHQMYSTSELHRLVAREHTGLLDRKTREETERSFIERRYAWEPNLLSATPTLEMGIDIGDLSSVVLCSVPPTQASYQQRIGRAGRRDGNAINLTLAAGRPHDLYFFADPLEMIAGEVRPPGVYLRATAVLERQLTAFCLQHWITEGQAALKSFPDKLGTLLNNVRDRKTDRFPYTFFEYVQKNEEALLSGFFGLFDDALQEQDQAHLRGFLIGDQGNEGSLAFKIVDALTYQQRERRALELDRNRLNTRVREMEARTIRDKNYENERRDLRIELGALNRLLQDLNEKNIFQFFTDEGRLPNYAFPEAGVTLKSIIYRRTARQRGKEKNEKANTEESYEQWTYEYERASAVALSELAPSSAFYAGGRRVEIDQINMRVSDVEFWQLCDQCEYSELLAGQKKLSSDCPRCGSPNWIDSGQKRKMIRMRQVMATTDDRKSRIADDTENREPNFFNRRMLVDFAPDDLKEAYFIDNEQAPFGFEFLGRATFRELNLGERGEVGSEVKIAGETYSDKGFVICESCGRLQQPHRPPVHTHSCSRRNKEDDSSLGECVFLYREFASEAIRILLPVSTVAYSPKRLQSLIAALQLGLERKFRGAVYHLETTLQDEPVAMANYRKRYLVLYDRIPGGTGYLKQLMLDEKPLLEVLETALDELQNCTCNQDPEKDGCYRCLYAYRHSNEMRSISRTTAVETITEILHHRTALKRVDNLRALSLHALIDSELEARFIEALRQFRMEKTTVQIRKQVVRGRPAHLLTITHKGKILSYTVESQVSLGNAEGVAIPCRADFVFRPTRASSEDKPIVVFTDGFTYHSERIHTDMAQRMALVQSGRYWIWSLTWGDVDLHLNKQAQTTGHSNEYLRSLAHPQQITKEGDYRTHLKLSEFPKLDREDSLTWLVRFLCAPEPSDWSRYAWMRVLMWTAPTNQAVPDAKLSDMATPEMLSLQEHLEQPRFHTHRNVDDASPQGKTPFLQIAAMLPQAEVRQPRPLRALVYVCFQDSHTQSEKAKHLLKHAWNAYLRLYNLFQYLPGACFTTQRGLAEGTFQALDLSYAAAFLRTTPKPSTAKDEGWEEIFDLVEEERLLDWLRTCKQTGWEAPEAMHELADSRGVLIAEAEVAWSQRKLAVVSAEQTRYAEAYQREGWRVVLLAQTEEDGTAFLKRYA